MDDLFDLLIESGEISPSVRYRQPSTAIISTLPVCSALSRPPRQIHLAPPTPTLHSPLTPDPRLTPKPIPIPVVLPSEKQLEVFLEETLSGRAGAGAQTLHCPLLDSPVEDVPSLGPEFELHAGRMGMEWMELPMMDGHREALGPDSLLPVSILPADLLDVQGFLSFQLH
ncbi:hypothetical protein GJAV_G00218250 [Gymnothorax javanicus]|nr:hypothetical protein GJAV_G00218250 [Gymnothorax javanicus]